jgi:flagellar biosynthesis protein FlhG
MNAGEARLIAVTSGKGGVGKTVLAANLAWALVRKGRRVLILDADLGLANLDILLHLAPVATLHEVLAGSRSLREVILEGPDGLHILPAGSGMGEYSRLTSDVRERLPELLAMLAHDYDYVFLDTGAGISDVVLFTAGLADDVIVVVTPEPTSLADAYATIKVMALQQQRSAFAVLVNQVRTDREGPALARQLQQVADRFLMEFLGRSVSLPYLGSVPADPAVERSVVQQRLVMIAAPGSASAQAVSRAAGQLESLPRPAARRLPMTTV